MLGKFGVRAGLPQISSSHMALVGRETSLAIVEIFSNSRNTTGPFISPFITASRHVCCGSLAEEWGLEKSSIAGRIFFLFNLY